MPAHNWTIKEILEKPFDKRCSGSQAAPHAKGVPGFTDCKKCKGSGYVQSFNVPKLAASVSDSKPDTVDLKAGGSKFIMRFDLADGTGILQITAWEPEQPEQSQYEQSPLGKGEYDNDVAAYTDDVNAWNVMRSIKIGDQVIANRLFVRSDSYLDTNTNQMVTARKVAFSGAMPGGMWNGKRLPPSASGRMTVIGHKDWVQAQSPAPPALPAAQPSPARSAASPAGMPWGTPVAPASNGLSKYLAPLYQFLVNRRAIIMPTLKPEDFALLNKVDTAIKTPGAPVNDAMVIDVYNILGARFSILKDSVTPA